LDPNPGGGPCKESEIRTMAQWSLMELRPGHHRFDSDLFQN